MPLITHLVLIFYIICAMHIVWYALVGGLLIYRHKEQHDKSRLFIGITMLYCAFGCCSFIVTAIVRGNPSLFLHTMLEPYPLILSFLPNLLLSMYILEVQQPHWLTWKRFLWLISPWMVMALSWLIYHGTQGWQYEAITCLTDVSQILAYIHQPDVILRLLILAIYVPYVLAMLFVRYNWRTSNISASNLKWLKLLVVLCVVGFALALGLRLHWAYVPYYIVLDILSISIVVIEKTARIPVPKMKEEALPASTDQPTLSPLAQRLQQLLEQQVWQNPELDRDAVRRILGTNYTYLSLAIQELGYVNFFDMINRQRAQYIHDELMQNPKASISDVIFRAGYRSRSTALRSFAEVYHCTPSDLLHQLKQ